MATAHETNRASFAAAIRATNDAELLKLARQYADEIGTTPREHVADLAADLAEVAAEIERRTRR